MGSYPTPLHAGSDHHTSRMSLATLMVDIPVLHCFFLESQHCFLFKRQTPVGDEFLQLLQVYLTRSYLAWAFPGVIDYWGQIRVSEETTRRVLKEKVTNFICSTPLQRSDPGSSPNFLSLVSANPEVKRIICLQPPQALLFKSMTSRLYKDTDAITSRDLSETLFLVTWTAAIWGMADIFYSVGDKYVFRYSII